MKLLVQSMLFAASFRSTSAFVNPKTAAFARNMSSALKSTPTAIVVNAEIEPDRMGEFIKLIEENAIASRKEPGCLRFGRFF